LPAEPKSGPVEAMAKPEARLGISELVGL